MRARGRGVVAPLIKLALFTVATGLATVFLASTLAPYGTGGEPAYRARFTDVTSLLPGDDIRIAGVRVGRVTDIRLVDDRVAEVTFTVDEAVTLPRTVQATIRYRNLVGQRYIALSEGSSAHGRLRPGGVIPLSQTRPALNLTVLFNGFRPLFSALSPQDVNRFSYEVIQVLQGEAGTVRSLLSRTASLTNTLADRDAVIGRVVGNLTQVLATLNARDDQLSEVIEQLQSFVSGLAADREAIGESLGHIAALTDQTAGLLSDARPALKSDIAKLRRLAHTLNANEDVITGTFERVPVRLAALSRVGGYGSWFNFYMCDWDGRVTFGDVVINPATFHSGAARCDANGGD
jgi:phospholipid/cholesterol/gamma-HCH transport system substrate-binding protein